MSRAGTIHEFWFGVLDASGQPEPGRSERWFKADAALDHEIRSRFEGDLRNAAAGRLVGWERHPRSALALILLFDQFPRNIYRGTPRAFMFDEHARAVFERAMTPENLAGLWPIERVFAFMPLEHAEDRAYQGLSVERFSVLLERADARDRPMFESFLEHAKRHRDVIQRFGRFPHRNAILGRESTAEEIAWLEESGVNWGQAGGTEADGDGDRS